MWVLYVETNPIIRHKERWYLERYAVPFLRGGKQVEIRWEEKYG